ncbi:hypothetical protein EV714DRAFT_240245 [Schizophyllum commune]
MDLKKGAIQRIRSCQLGMDAARNELVDPLVDERLLPHIYAPDNPGDPLRRPPSPRRALEPRNESLLECHTANPMARPTIGYCVETLTRPGYMRTNLDPPRQHGPRLMSETERLSWLSDQRRQQYTGQSTSIDTQLVARHWPEHVDLLNNRFYADFYSSIFPREFPMLERITPDLHSATRTVLDAPTPPTVRDLPLGVLSLDADRPTTEAYEMGSEIATIIQEVLYYLSLRDMQETQVAADRLMRCSQAMLHLPVAVTREDTKVQIARAKRRHLPRVVYAQERNDGREPSAIRPREPTHKREVLVRNYLVDPRSEATSSSIGTRSTKCMAGSPSAILPRTPCAASPVPGAAFRAYSRNTTAVWVHTRRMGTNSSNARPASPLGAPSKPTSPPAAEPSLPIPATPTTLALEQQHITTVEGIVPTLQNIVATVKSDCCLEFQTVAVHARNAEYSPKCRLRSSVLPPAFRRGHHAYLLNESCGSTVEACETTTISLKCALPDDG